MTDRPVDQLSDLLEIEREALLRGDLAAVGELIEEKEALVSQFDSANAQELRILSTALLHNSRLIAAAKEGVTDVMKTLAQQKAARTSLSTYDASGNAHQIAATARGTERRY